MMTRFLSNSGHILKEELNYEMLYLMFEKINDDLKGLLSREKEELERLFRECEKLEVSAEQALLKHTARITSYTNTAMFYAKRETPS